MAVVNPEKIAELLAECADAYVMPRYRQLKDEEISSKTGPQDLVTQADIDVEAHLERVLPDISPGSIVVGEEGVSRGEHSLDVLARADEKVWIVDPVDGTYNFVHGKREFAVMLACVINGRTEYSWIYDVLGGQCAIAERGSGAYFGDERLAVDRSAQSDKDLVGFVAPRHFPEEFRPDIKRFMENFNRCEDPYCAAFRYLYVAQGKAHFSLHNHKLKVWDHLPGNLLVEEAEGYLARWNGVPYAPLDDCSYGFIVAPDQDVWERIRELLFKELDEDFLVKYCSK